MNVNEHWVDESDANDSDVFHGLVRQPSKIPQKHSQEDSTNHSEPMDCKPNVTGAQDSCIVNDSTSDFVAASHRLTRLARENGFTVHGAPGDGNCSML